ncbi:hybrid sensor histidine kinase/response regulator [Labilibacter marinus]|uniref:hybrid sensor histidine kinase/response regulator n=1 Tax=Labilibacter marinus TaxID=1477105 RepID=UPI00094F52E2|nr:hybrid sensor histidine kinase/response regulator [Labilibacter marinus]
MRNGKEYPAIFYIDDEKENLLGFKTSYYKDFNIITASNKTEANQILDEHKIAVFLVDFKMPDEDGLSFVMRIKDQFPDAIFILVTAYTNMDLVINAFNFNVFFQFIQKPWNYLHLKSILYSALEKYALQIEKKQLMESLQVSLKNEQRANKLKREFLNNISHEIRTPLNSILGFTEYAKNETGDTHLIPYLELVYKSGKELLDTVENVLEASLIITGQTNHVTHSFNPFNLITNITRDIKLKYYNLNNIELNNLVNPDINLNSDKESIYKILSNIIDNAVNYSKDGRVKIELKKKHHHDWQFSVWNKGVMNNKISEQSLFDPFYRGNNIYPEKRGSGLGLFNAKSLAKSIGGDISYTSSYINQTTFYFNFTEVP